MKLAASVADRKSLVIVRDMVEQASPAPSPLPGAAAPEAEPQPASPGFAGTARLAGWATIDQAVSSITNAGLSILVARAVGAHSYGAFAVAFSVYTFLIGVSASFGSAPFSIRSTRLAGAAAARARRAASGGALLVGLVFGVIAVVVGAVVGGEAGDCLIAVGAFLAPLYVQDCWRTLLTASRRPRGAAANDTLWAVVQFAGLGALVAAGVHSPWPYVVVWGTAAVAAAAYGVVQTRAVPSLRLARDWIVRHRDLSGFIALEWLTIMGAGQLAILAVAGISTIAAVGSLRGALTLLGPLNAVMMASFALAVPEITRRDLTPHSRLRLALAISAFFTVLCLAWGAVLLALPTGVGRALLGATWPGAHRVLLPLSLQFVAIGASWGAVIMLRAVAAVRANVVVNGIQGPLLVLGALIGASQDGATGAAAGFAAAAWAVLPLWWIAFRRVQSVPLVDHGASAGAAAPRTAP